SSYDAVAPPSYTLSLHDALPISDLVVVERTGPFISVDQAREIVRQASLSPVEGGRKVLLLVDFHLVQNAAPMLLKIIEEPPAGRSEEHTSELQSPDHLVCRLLLE